MFCRHFRAVKLVRNSCEFWVSKDFSRVATLCKAIHIQWADLHYLAGRFWCSDRMFDTPSLRLCLLCCLVIWELIWLYYWLFALWNLPTNNRPKQQWFMLRFLGFQRFVAKGQRDTVHYIRPNLIKREARSLSLSLWWSWGQTGHMTSVTCLT